MGNILAAIGAVLLAIKDILTPRLFFLALLCFILVACIAFGAAWGALEIAEPYIQDGEGPFRMLTRALELAAGLGALLLVFVFAPAVAMFVSGFLFDIAAAKVERAIGAPAARDVPISEALWNAVRLAVPALLLNLLILPVLIVPPAYPIVFLIVNGFLFGRELFTQAAIRHAPWKEALALRRRAPLSTFLIGLALSFVPFVAPLLGASAMARFSHYLRTKTAP